MEKVVVFLLSGCNREKWLYSDKSGCIRASGCILAEVVVFGQKLLYLDKEVVFGQKLLYSSKSCCIRKKRL